MSRTLTTEEIRAILKSGDFDRLLDSIEHPESECKRQPYRLEDESQKRELAKDVSAFLNAAGGLILIGTETSRELMTARDVIAAIRPFSRTHLNVEQYRHVVASWIYPPAEITVEWYPSKAHPEQGIAAITVPEAPNESRPFLVRKPITDGGRTSEIVFGYIERRRDSAIPFTIELLHAWLRDGRRFERLIGQEFERLRADLQSSLPIIPPQVPPQIPSHVSPTSLVFYTPEQERARRVDEALISIALSQRPAIVLTATPLHQVVIPSLFASRNASVVRLLEHPPQLRPSGFDLETGESARIVRGVMRRAVSIGDKLLELWRDGMLLFIGSGEDNFLSWARRRPGDPLRINPLVLTESTFLFLELFRQLGQFMEPRPTKIEFELRLCNFPAGEKGAGIIPARVDSPAWRFGTDRREVPAANMSGRVTREGDLLDPGSVGFDLIKQVYAWFGIEEDQIPYTTESKGHRVIDVPSITRN